MNLLIKPNWPAPSSIQACTTTRSFWGEKIKEETANERFKLTSLLQLPKEPIWLNQTHSNMACEAIIENKEQNADASFTDQINHVCVVLTADCLPILMCNRSGTKVAAIHAGWRGLANGIIENTFAELSNPAEDLMVWLGPAIGPQKFEVGEDVWLAFTSQHPESKTGFTAYKQGKWLANLYQLAKIRLKTLGISQIYGGTFCTYTQKELFYSYRRDKGITGRMASLIWIS